MVLGFGETRMMSSKGIIFFAGNGLKLGMKEEIAVAWPFLLDGRVPLQLVLDTDYHRYRGWCGRSANSGVRFPHPTVIAFAEPFGSVEA